jgi:hypothetical protein
MKARVLKTNEIVDVEDRGKNLAPRYCGINGEKYDDSQISFFCDSFLRPGGYLPNGALIIVCDNDYVLAHWKREFVTWKIDDDMNTYDGHYFSYNDELNNLSELRSAVEDLVNRGRALKDYLRD